MRVAFARGRRLIEVKMHERIARVRAAIGKDKLNLRGVSAGEPGASRTLEIVFHGRRVLDAQ